MIPGQLLAIISQSVYFQKSKPYSSHVFVLLTIPSLVAPPIFNTDLSLCAVLSNFELTFVYNGIDLFIIFQHQKLLLIFIKLEWVEFYEEFQVLSKYVD
jgi:hypothetical protein